MPVQIDICTNEKKGKPCGGAVKNGICMKCFADYRQAKPADTGGGGNTATLRQGGRATGRPTGRGTGSKLLASTRGTTEIASGGMLPYHALGLKSARQRLNRGSTTIRLAAEIGGGYVPLPETLSKDPSSLVKLDLMQGLLAERVCPKGHALVRPNAQGKYALRCDPTGKEQLSGRCPQCTTEYDLTNLGPAPLLPGEIIRGKYESYGPCYVGGQGYVSIGVDRDVGRIVVLKAQKKQSDQDRRISDSEKRGLVLLGDASIVPCLDFIVHRGIPIVVLGWVDGDNIEEVQDSNGGPFSVSQACALGIDASKSVSYQHAQGWIACDLKPSNFMKTAPKEGRPSALVQIDGGGWRRADDRVTPISCTEGWEAPEIGDPAGKPAVFPESDQFTMTKMVLWWFSQFDIDQYRFDLPDLAEFRRYPSLKAWARRGMAKNYLDRFPSMEEWAYQLRLVLNEVLAIDSLARPVLASSYFQGDRSAGSPDLSAQFIPVPRFDEADAAWQDVETALAFEGEAAERLKQLELAEAKFPKSREVKFRIVGILGELGAFQRAEQMLAQLAAEDTEDWRDGYFGGILALASKQWEKAVVNFDSVVAALPGEPGAKLAQAIAASLAKRNGVAKVKLGGQQVDTGTLAVTLYGLVLVVEPSFTTAAFQLATLLSEEGSRQNAVQSLRLVPAGSIAHFAAEMKAAEFLLSAPPAEQTMEDVERAAQILLGVEEDRNADWQRLAASVLENTLDLVQRGIVKADAQKKIIGCEMTERQLRFGIEMHLFAASHFCGSEEESAVLSAKALAMRPVTLF